jgi:hypothetical protein
MRAGFNPTRRNRNIGTAKQGHGQNNRLVIPSICYAERSWELQLKTHSRHHRTVAGRSLLFLVENLTPDFQHACPIDDVCQMLEFVPKADWNEIGCFILRQPTFKQQSERPAWGRVFYYGCVGRPNQPDTYAGPLVILEAQNWARSIKWSPSLPPEDNKELQRLEADGHSINRVGRRIEICSTQKSVRATQLFRTLLHEIGHWHDYQQRVELPSAHPDADYGELTDAYFARPSHEREAYAHRYADRLQLTLRENGSIPF